MTPRNDNPISSELHQQLLRMHCEEPVNAIAAAVIVARAPAGRR